MSITATPLATASTTAGTRRRPPGATVAVGGFYLCMAGIHIGIAAADPQTYAGFADGSPWSFVRNTWADVFMADPRAWGLAVAGGEILLGVLLLVGGLAARAGWIGTIIFQALLVLFAWGLLVWSLPAAAVLALGARHDWAALGPPAP